MAELVRLDKWLSDQGFGSRRTTQALIKSKKISIDGKILSDPKIKVPAKSQDIFFEKQPIIVKNYYHIMLNKPAGYITSTKDVKQKTVMDLLPIQYKQRKCMPVGRLDKDTTGLLFFTTDGNLMHSLLSPKNQVEKTYIVEISGSIEKNLIDNFKKGVVLKHFTALPAKLDIIYSDMHLSKARVTIYEGKHHQIKLMFGKFKKSVLSLHRESFAGIKLDSKLSPGQYRLLTEEEYNFLQLQT